MTATSYSVTALCEIPAIRPGDDLARAALAGMESVGLAFADGDVLVLAQKIVSKSEGRQVALERVVPSARALTLSQETGKDARLVELILREAIQVVRVRANLIIVQHRLGLVLANAGIDQSNVGEGEGYDEGPQALLLPLDPDASAARLRDAVEAATGARVAVIIIDSLGRAWRVGTVGTAIGVAGIPALLDLRGKPDINGRPLQSSELGLADEIAAAASLAMGQAGEGTPMAMIRGLPFFGAAGQATDLIRPPEMNLFP